MVGKLEGGDRLEDLGIDGRILLECVGWLKMGTSGRLL